MPRSRFVARRFVHLALLLLVLAATGRVEATAGSCIDGNIATPVTMDLWGDLEPVDVGPIASARDSTNYTGQQLPDDKHPLFSSIDVEDGYAFTSWTFGLHIWNIGGGFADQPRLESTLWGHLGNGFPSWPGLSEVREFFWDVDAPEGDASIVAMAARTPVGVAIVDTQNKTSPTTLYQDTTPYAVQVYSARIANRDWAFVAAQKTGSDGVRLYDMTAARSLNRCVEAAGASQGTANCPNVFRGVVGINEPISYVDGVATPNGGHFVAFSSGVAPRGVGLYDVSNPLSAVNVKSGGGRLLPDEMVYGVALFRQGSSYYLAIQAAEGARIYNATSCLTGGCSSLGSPIWSERYDLPLEGRWVTFSRSGDGTPYLYYGMGDKCSGGLQREWLYDVSNPASPDEVTPDTTKVVNDPETGAPVEIDYWGYYYARNPTGFSQITPRAGKFHGNNFYRVAWTLFDIHRRVDANPSIVVSGPASGYRGDSIPFTAQAFNCTPNPSGWSWSPSGGGTTTSSSASANVTWTTNGTKSVSATNSACPGAIVTAATVSIVAPDPVVTAATAQPTTAFSCQPITFSATATGKPPLSYAWQVKNADQAVVDSGAGANFTWNTTQADQGSFTGHVTVTGTGTPATATTAPVTLNALPTLPGAEQFTPTNLPFSSATVDFNLDVPGATEWNWDFGDGQGFTGWTNDPVTGPNPTHTYGAVGDYDVVVKVRQCGTGEVPSAPLSVSIVQLTPLVANFSASLTCSFGVCTGVPAGQAVAFTDDSTGATFWDYDWDGNGSFEDAGNTAARTSHVYSQPGDYSPVLRVRRGSESNSFVHSPIKIVPAQPASISVGGASSGTVGQSLAFNASASNCTPAPNGWSWTATGATVQETDSSIVVSFSSAGTKTVQAKNSACGNATGSRSVTISTPGGGGGGSLQAAFSFTPSAPVAGNPVNFNGSASTGNPAVYAWNFGDGSSGSGATVSHTYAAPGTYSVTLMVSPANCVSPGCSSSTSKQVVVGGDGGGGGGGGGGDATIAAQFDFAPASPSAGVPVGFDAGASTGNPSVFGWTFGDGGTGSGATVSHTYAAPGTYPVTLSVATAACTSPGCSASITKTVVVGSGSSAGANGCTGGLADDVDKLCLGEGRFVVEVDWENHHQPTRPVGEGQSRRLGDSERAGLFWFFNPDSIDLIVKIIDGSVVNEHVWVFYGALTDVIYDLKVTDTLTGQTKSYRNKEGSICGRGDTTAFSTAGLSVPATASAPALTGDAANVTGEATQQEVLSLLDGRFRATVQWENQHAPELHTGTGKSVAGSNGTGYFWFFEQSTLDLVVKMIDARAFDGQFWVFYGGLSDVKYTIHIEDTVTGETWERTNPPGSICGGSDTRAFSALGN